MGKVNMKLRLQERDERNEIVRKGQLFDEKLNEVFKVIIVKVNL